MNDDAKLTEAEAKRQMIAEFLEDHGETVNAYPLLSWEVSVLYRDMDELPMRWFRGGIKCIERICDDEGEGSSAPCWYCAWRHEGWVYPV